MGCKISFSRKAVATCTLLIVAVNLQGCSEGHGSGINLCGTEIQPCRVDDRDIEGKWDTGGFCYEDIGGNTVRAVCITLPGDFATKTRQPNWAEARRGKPHCVAIGAYSWYHNQENVAQPHCKSIDKEVFSLYFLPNWKRFKLNAWIADFAESVVGSLALMDKCLEQCSDNTTMILEWCCMMSSEARVYEEKDLKSGKHPFAGLGQAVTKHARDRYETYCGDRNIQEVCEDHWKWTPSTSTASWAWGSPSCVALALQLVSLSAMRW